MNIPARREMLKMSLALAAFLVVASPAAQAQNTGHGGFQVHQKKLDKVQFYNSPRQMQILDERPMIRDFREAPGQSPMISLPPGPTAAGGGYGGGGAGALGDMPGGGGAPVTMGPSPGQLPYRTDTPQALPLPKSGFNNNPSNIPAGGLGPRNALPGGQTTNRLMGKMMTPKPTTGHSAGAPAALSGPRAKGPAKVAAPAPASYGNTYQSSGSGYGGGSSRTESAVRGTLLKQTK